MKKLILGFSVLGLILIGTGLYPKAKAVLAHHLLDKAWQQQLETGQKVSPWSGMEATPAFKLRMPNKSSVWVLNGWSGQALAFGAGFLPSSAFPGTEGAVMVAGHQDTVFRSLKDLSIGDRLQVDTPTHQLMYQVDHIEVVDSRTRRLINDPSENRLILITCYPFSDATFGGPLRYVVSAMQIEVAVITARPK